MDVNGIFELVSSKVPHLYPCKLVHEHIWYCLKESAFFKLFFNGMKSYTAENTI